ncbi:MAG: ferrous iron transport protein B [Spirochaetia bacterium]|nr:ferrous iron transport protein B [Spirochaetia bacterium]
MNAIATPQIALIGNPNTGKTTVFNALCGTRQRVGNYPGVTVEKKIGFVSLPSGPAEILDLPGLYSLKAVAPDEQVACDVLMGRLPGARSPNLIVCVLDATNLKRNLLIFTQIIELDIPVVIALTMTDLLDREGIKLNLESLTRGLGVPVVCVSARDPATLEHLKNTIVETLAHPTKTRINLAYPVKLERTVSLLNGRLNKFVRINQFETRNLLLFENDPVAAAFSGNQEALSAIEDARKDLGNIDPGVIASERFRWAGQVVSMSETRSTPGKIGLGNRIDRILTHRLFGLLAFIGIMYMTFQSIYTWAAPLMDAISAGFAWLGDAAGAIFARTPMLQSLVSDGVIGGVGSVLVFLPQIVILFTFIAILEDSGYLSRAAFLMDKLLAWSGLNGRAFIPMLSSFACAVPGVMASRVIPDARARMATVLVSPLMSCSARLPVYLLMIGAFIEPRFGPSWAAFTLFAMHALGLLVALPVSWIINRGVLKTPTVPFVLEMPPYRMPQIRNVAYRVYEASRRFVVRAGSVIFAMSIVIWALSYFPRPDIIAQDSLARAAIEIASLKTAGNLSDARAAQILDHARFEADSQYLEQSYLGRAGKLIQPAFAPLGFDWKITVGVLAAFPAREVIISALGIIYSVGKVDAEHTEDLKTTMMRERRPDGSPVFTPLLAVTLMVFFALCCQCMSTVVTVQRELASWPLAIFMFCYMTGLAYVSGLLIYQGGRALGLG